MKNLSPHEPIRNDQSDVLNRKELASRILARLCDENCPSVIGIYGGWGSGKSSLLNLLKRQFDGPSGKHLQNGRVLHFLEEIDAWKYESTGNLFVPVVARVAKELKDRKSFDEKLSAAASRVIRVTGQAAIRAMMNLADEKAGKIFEELRQGIQNQDGLAMLTWVDEVEETENAFRQLVESLRGGEVNARLVICVDNLDRCSPENAIHLLESVKNFTNVPGCVWVFFMDQDVIASFVTKKYEGTILDGNSYLDKIIPEQYHLPAPLPQTERDAIEALLLSVIDTDELRENIYVAVNLLAEIQIPRLTVPRRLIKTAIKLEQYMRTPDHAWPDMAFVLILLYHSWPDFYERMVSENTVHIEGILSNFVSSEPTIQISKKYLDDKDLMYYLRMALIKNQDTHEVVGRMLPVLKGLRAVGLP